MTTFTDKQKRTAVALYLEHGAAHAAAEIGCDRRSIYRWLGSHGVTPKTDEQRHAETAARHAEKRAQLKELLLDTSLDLLLRIDQADGRDARGYATAAAILIDKYRLEAGEATTRHEQVHESDIDREVRRLVGELARSRQSETETGAVAGSPPPGTDTAD